MPFVGELIMSAREAFPDLPIQTLSIPGATGVGAASTVAGSLLDPTKQYYFRTTFLTPWGETLPGTEAFSIGVLGGNQVILSITSIPPGATGIRVYYGTATGQELAWMNFSVTSTSGTQNVTVTGIGAVSGGVPIRNSAYLADSDGRALSAYRVFGWLTDGLRLAGNLVGGGIPDLTGFSSAVGQPWYELLNSWKKIDGAWYEGYPVFFGRKTDVFRKNSVSGISAALVVDYYGESVRIEVWPQPSVTAGLTSLVSAVGLTDTQAVCVATSSFTLPLGLAMLGTAPNCEIVSYQSIGSNRLSGILRGWGGTNAQSWPVGTPVRQLNGMLSGFRIPTSYFPGDSLKTLRLPAGWEDPLSKYLMHRFRLVERKNGEAKELLNEFTAGMQKLLPNKQFAGPIQIQTSTGRGSEVYPGLGGPFGGVIVP